MAENIGKNGCSERDSAEHKGYAKALRSFNRIWKERDSAQPKLLEAILYKDNFNRAYKRVKANKGAPSIDRMTIRQRRGILLNWGYPNTMHISQPTAVEATGLCLVWGQ